MNENFACVCVCVCVCARARARVCVCVCVFNLPNHIVMAQCLDVRFWLTGVYMYCVYTYTYIRIYIYTHIVYGQASMMDSLSPLYKSSRLVDVLNIVCIVASCICTALRGGKLHPAVQQLRTC